MFTNIISRWKIARNFVSPKITLIGECQDLRGESIMIVTAIVWIVKAKQFNGKLHSTTPMYKANSAFTVEFTIEFTNEDDANKFCEFVIQFNNKGFWF